MSGIAIGIVIGVTLGAVLLRIFGKRLEKLFDRLGWAWFCFRWGPVHDFFKDVRKEIGEVGEEMVKLGEKMIDASEDASENDQTKA